jgi:energy-coupling factor transporter ATP-binding protein EcfA2
MVQLDGTNIPLEMVGTGCLQAIQLVAYVTAYNPALLLLDEPDAHLHPSNQRTLATTLQKITEDTATKIILATHSRHIFDALTYNDYAKVIWLKDGIKQDHSDRDSLSILLDLGALDSYELLQKGGKRLILLTEDSKVSRLKVILKAHGLEEGDYLIQPLQGVDNLSASIPVADFFTKQGDNTYVVVHRDGDCMTQGEKSWWVNEMNEKLPERTYLFVTPLSDIEHAFCQPDHISSVYGMSQADAKALVEQILKDNNTQFVVEFTQKRTDLKSKALRHKKDAASAGDLLASQIEFWQVRGKSLFPFILNELKKRGCNPAHLTEKESLALVDPGLKNFVGAMKGHATGQP